MTKKQKLIEKSLLLTSYNVTSLASILKKSPSLESIKTEGNYPDVVCLQETKLSDLTKLEISNSLKNEYPHRYFWNSKRKGYAGTCVWSKEKLLNVHYGFHPDVKRMKDEEGRVITFELEGLIICAVYVPNAGMKLERLDWKLNHWWPTLEDHLEIYMKEGKEKGTVVRLIGDLNVAHKEIDLARPKTNQKTPGFTPQEREHFSKLLEKFNYVDIYRELNPETIFYTYFSHRFNCHSKNIGWRLDYFLTTRNEISVNVDKVGSGDWGNSDHIPITLFLTL
jgi:exodeoxyribonuclease III